MPRKKKQKNISQSESDSASQAAISTDQASKNKKADPDKQHRRKTIAFALIIIVLLGIIASMVASQLLPEYKILAMPRKAVAMVMAPVQRYFSSGTNWFVNYIQRLKLRSNIEYEYEQLYEKYDDLLSQVMLLNELQVELNEYSDLAVEMQRHSQFDGVPAKVISTDSTNYFSTLEINVGSNQGIGDYMAVVKSGGLVGYTYDVSPTTSKVQTIINSDTSIPALIESTRYQGTVKGTMGINGEPSCRMYYLSDNHLPRQGDTVVTSGVGVEFPKGIPIGIVRESTRGMEEGKSYVVIEPIVDFERVEYVIVYRYVPNYAEQAEQRDESGIVYTGLPTARPVPTFPVNGEDAFGLTSSETVQPASESTEAPSAVESAGTNEQSETTIPDIDNKEPTMIPNLSYGDTPPTPSPVPTPTPEPTPTPTPTFSLGTLTDDAEE